MNTRERSAGSRLRIANWNVERPRPKGWKVPAAQKRRMAEVDADVWVLTETHLHHAPSDEHTEVVFSPEYPERRPHPERWTAIWSRWPIREVTDPEANRRGTVAALIDLPSSTVCVYGTVIPWANEPHLDDGTPARMWQAHLAGIDRQGGEWRRIRERFPDVPLVVAGDFNQDRDGSGWYGTAEVRERLSSALEQAGLICVTEMDVVAEGMLRSHHLIDHICVTPDLANSSIVSCRENIDDSGQRLSDHPTVVVDLELG